MLLAAVLGWMHSGAWGVSIATLSGMGAALILLVQAAAASPRADVRPSSSRAGMLPRQGEPLRLVRRIVTFVLIAILAMASAGSIAVAGRGVATALGSGEADANTLALFLMPLAWAALAFCVLMEARRTRQIAILAVGMMTALPAFLFGAAG